MLFANIVVVQYCVTTKAAPPNPMQKRTMHSDQNEFTDMPRSVKTAIQESKENWQILGPTLSQSGPMAKRQNTVPATDRMFVVKTWLRLSSRSALTRTMSGAKANQHTKAQKKDNHAKWKARMCGRATEKSRISVALKPSAGFTGMPESAYHLPASFSWNWYLDLGSWYTSPAPASPPPSALVWGRSSPVLGISSAIVLSFLFFLTCVERR